MNFVIQHTEYLISRHECVIIPGLGAVLAHYESAKYDSASRVILPPRRIFTFNGFLRQTDGLLACSIAKAEGISFDLAIERINQAAKSMNCLLRQSGELPLGRIGNLTYNKEENTIHFTPADAPFPSADTCGLPSVASVDVSAESEPVDESAPAQLLPAPVQYSPAARFLRIAACLCALLAIGFVASTPISVEDAALASLSPEIKHVSTEELQAAESEPLPAISLIQAHNPDACIEIDALPAKAFCSLESIRTSGKRYLVIIGSFAASSEAITFIERRNNPALRFFEKDGRFRVFASAFEAESDAYRDINANGYGDTGAWVCHI